ncbi:hypothetical protein ALP61_03088, partial [Pseudomonas savastanoi]
MAVISDRITIDISDWICRALVVTMQDPDGLNKIVANPKETLK